MFWDLWLNFITQFQLSMTWEYSQVQSEEDTSKDSVNIFSCARKVTKIICFFSHGRSRYKPAFIYIFLAQKPDGLGFYAKNQIIFETMCSVGLVE